MKSFTFDKQENYRTFLIHATMLGFTVQEDIRYGLTLWLSEIPKHFARLIMNGEVVGLVYNDDPNA